MSLTVDVRPASGRHESLAVALVTVVVIGGTLAYAATRPETGAMPTLAEWQVSAFDGLGPADQAIHSAIGPAIEEAIFRYDFDGYWPTAGELAESFISPFHQDIFWETNGQVDWALHRPEQTDQGSVYYLGRAGQVPGQSAYLALIRHQHLNTVNTNQLDLWVHADPRAPEPTGVTPQSLVRQGWRQVVTYSGASEVERIKGR